MRIIILGGPKRGKTTLAKQLRSKSGLIHMCTDPMRMCGTGVTGTPDDLEYSGDHGVGAYVAQHWLTKMPDQTVIEGVKAADALNRICQPHGSMSRKTSYICDRIILLTERVDDGPVLRGQEQQASHVLNVVEALLNQDLLDNLELWYPTGSDPATFAQANHY